MLTSTSSEQSGQFFETTLRSMSEQERDQLFYEFVQGRKEKVMMQQVDDEQYIVYVTRRARLKKKRCYFFWLSIPRV